mmetsp:Transcript_4613/g.11296  ORF Transcript_4613/g.11296 Transcript_4613/m.11296 type:complete len:148 (-) Transcript_4613:666-1109(-)
MKLTEEVVVLGHGTLTLEDLNQDTGLVVSVGRERLVLLGRDGGVALDQLGHDTSGSLQTHGERSDIQQQNVGGGRSALVGQDRGLHGGTVRDSLIRVYGSVRLLAVEELLQHRLHLRNTGGTTDQHDFVHVLLVNAGVTQRLLNRSH